MECIENVIASGRKAYAARKIIQVGHAAQKMLTSNDGNTSPFKPQGKPA